MTGFVAKQINDRSIGDILREKREERKETPDDVERATQVAKKYLAAFENNDFKRLPDLVYARNFLRTLAAHYGLDPKRLVDGLTQELGAMRGREASAGPAKPSYDRRFVLTPKTVKSALVAAVFLAIVGYFAYSVNRILTPPALAIYSPSDNQVISGRQVLLAGKTEPGVELTVNREEVLTETDGSFKDSLDLPGGVSILRVAAKRKHSKENEIYVKVIVEDKTGSATATESASGTPEA